MVVTRHAQQAACDAQKKNLRRFCSQVISERRPLVEMTSERRDKEVGGEGSGGGTASSTGFACPAQGQITCDEGSNCPAQLCHSLGESEDTRLCWEASKMSQECWHAS